MRRIDVPEDLLSHVVPSEEVRMVPLLPTVAKILFTYLTPKREFDVPDVLTSQEVLDVHVVPSGEVRMFPPVPTATKVLFA